MASFRIRLACKRYRTYPPAHEFCHILEGIGTYLSDWAPTKRVKFFFAKELVAIV